MHVRLNALPTDVQQALARTHEAMCAALDHEMRAEHRDPIPLPAGRRMPDDAGAGSGSGTVYEFAMPHPSRLHPDQSMRFVPAARPGAMPSTYGAVVLPDGGRVLRLAIPVDLGPTMLAGGRLVPPDSVPLIFAQEILRGISAGLRSFNADVALRFLGQPERASALFVPDTPIGGDIPESFARLWPGRWPDEPNEAQLAAVHALATRSLSAALGPAGTGKTSTAVAGIEWLMQAACAPATHGGGAVRRPRVLVAAPSNAAVDEAIGRMVDRLSRHGDRRLGALLRVGRNITPAFRERYGEWAESSSVAARVRAEQMRRAVDSAVRIEERLDELDELRVLLTILPQDHHEERLELLRRIRVLERYAARAESVARERARRFEAARARSEAHLEDELVRTCEVLGATAHTALMRHAIRDSGWDVVVIDEASMLPAALAYCLATLARERVWFLGDPRQLPAVVCADTPLSAQWLARDAFATSDGVLEHSDGSLHLADHVVRIGPNRRMHPEIAALVAPAYGGSFETDPAVARARLAVPPLPFSRPSRSHHGAYLADTSDLGPLAEYAPGGSRINKMHGATVRGLVTLLHEHRVVGPGRGSLAIISPYVAQARLHARMLARHFPRTPARAGTAHTYQAQEADVVLLDLVEGRGIPVYEWMRVSRWSDEGSRLLLVSLTRARNTLIVCADVAGLRAQLEPLHPRPLLLSILDQLEGCGAIDVASQVRDRADKLRQIREHCAVRASLPAQPKRWSSDSVESH